MQIPSLKKVIYSLAFVCSLASLTQAESPLNSSATPKTKITIAEYGEYPLYTVLYVADALGHFAAEGLEVEIVPAGGDEKVFAALLSGDAQFGVSDPTFTAISGSRGRPGRVIAAVLQNIPAWGVARDPKITAISNPAQLAGLRIGTFPAPSTSYTLQKEMLSRGATDAEIIQIAWGALLPALEAGRIDIALENEPNVSLAESQGARKVYSLSDSHPEFAFTGLMALPEYLEQHPEIAQRVVNAFQRATNSLFDDTPAAVAVLTKRFPQLSPAVLEKAIQNCMAANTFPKNGIVSEQGWEAAIGVRTRVGDLRSEAPYREYVVTKFAEQASRIQGSRAQHALTEKRE